MISSASTLLLATLVFNAASVFGAPLRYPDADMVVRAEITEPIVPRVRFASSREIPEVRDTVLPPVEKREASTEESNLHRRFPRRVYHDFYQKHADPVSPPVARAPKPDSERRFPRRVYHDLNAARADSESSPPVARDQKAQSERRYPRRALYEKRHDVPAPVPTAVANSTDTTSVINNFINSTTNQNFPPGTTIKETTVLLNKVTYVSDKNAPAPAAACNPAPPAGSSSVASGSPTSSTASPTATVPAAATSSAAAPAATSSTANPAATSSAADPAATSSAADPAATTSSAASSTSDAQPTATPGAADPSAPAANATPTTTSAADPAASTDGSNARRSFKDVTNEPVAREPEPVAAAPASEKPQRRSGPLVPYEPAFVKRSNVQRTSGPSEPGTLSAPSARAQQQKRGPILPRRLGFSGAALASFSRRSNNH